MSENRINEYRESKRKKRAETNKIYWKSKSQTINENRRVASSKLVESRWAEYKRRQRKKNDERKEKERLRKQKYRLQKKNSVKKTKTDNTPWSFPNRMSKSRAKRRVHNILPRTPERRRAVIRLFDEELVGAVDTDGTSGTTDCIVSDLKEVVQELKLKRSDDARIALNILSASVSGENVKKSSSSSSLGKKLGINRRRISG